MEKKVTLSMLTYYDDKLKKWTLNKVEEVNDSIPTVLSQLINDTNFIDNTVNDLINYYTKNEIDNKLAESGIGIKIVQVDVRPETGEPNTIYLVNAQKPTSEHAFDKYLYVNGKWEEFGQGVDLTGYLKKEEADKLYTKVTDLNKVVEKEMIGDNGKSIIANDPTGGILKFTTNDGKEAGIAVNDGSEDMLAQIYAKDAESGQGARLAFNEEGAYYTVSDNHSFTAEDKLITQKDLSESMTLEII